MSNGSERVRELPTPKPDYEALIGRLHAVSFGDDWPDVKRLLWDARNAVEALVAENTRLRLDAAHVRVEAFMTESDNFRAQRESLEAERDALRAQLDSMHERDEVGVQVGSWPPTTYQDLGLALYYAAHPFKGYEEYEHKVVTRRTLTGPWTVVEGDDQ